MNDVRLTKRRLALWIVTSLVAIAAIVTATWAIRYATAEPKGKIEAQEQIQSAAYRIAAYEHFYDLCAAIQGHEAQLTALARELETAQTEANRERIQASLTGVSAQRQRSIAQYNADARKDYTAGQFRSSDLPYQLDPEAQVTTCVA